MNRKLTTITFVIGSAVLLGIGGVILYGNLKSKPEIPKKKEKVLQEETAYKAEFSFQGPENIKTNQILPILMKFETETPPNDKGLTGIKIVVKFIPSENLSFSLNDIQETLPKPWRYLRQEIDKNGEINLEAVYLQPGKNGYLATQEQTLAILNFKTKREGEVKFILDAHKSYLIDKDNQRISFQNDASFSCMVFE